MNQLQSITGAVAAGMIAASAGAQIVTHAEQWPRQANNSLASDAGEGNLWQLAESFTIAESVTIDTVDFAGHYQALMSIPVSQDDFTIRIYADDAGLPALTPIYETNEAAVVRTPEGVESYATYVAVLPKLVTLDAGTYWLSVQNHHVGVGRWGWSRIDTVSEHAITSIHHTGWELGIQGDLVFSLSGPKGLVHFYDFELGGKDHAGRADATPGPGAAFIGPDNNAAFALGHALTVPAGGDSTDALGLPSVEALPILGSDFSVSFTYRADGLDSGAGDEDTIIDAIDDSTGWSVFTRDGEIVARFRSEDSGGVVTTREWSSGPLMLGAASLDWHHYAFVCDRSSTAGGQWYVSGQPVGPAFDATALEPVVAAEGFRLGASDSSGDGADGAIDRVRVYNIALSPGQVASLAAEVSAAAPSCGADLNGDAAVGGGDLAILLAAWGSCP